MNARTTRLCIVRHGETDWNAQQRIQGQIDISLNRSGRAQAVAVSSALAGARFDGIYSSDLARAWQTALPIADTLGLPVKAATALRERHYGRMQGLTREEARVRFPALHAAYIARQPDYDLDGGETLSGFAVRVADVLRALVDAHRGQTLLLVAHGGVLDITYRLATGRGLDTPRDFPVPNAALNWLEYRDAAWHVVSWGEGAHLGAALDELTQ